MSLVKALHYPYKKYIDTVLFEEWQLPKLDKQDLVCNFFLFRMITTLRKSIAHQNMEGRKHVDEF